MDKCYGNYFRHASKNCDRDQTTVFILFKTLFTAVSVAEENPYLLVILYALPGFASTLSTSGEDKTERKTGLVLITEVALLKS